MHTHAVQVPDHPTQLSFEDIHHGLYSDVGLMFENIPLQNENNMETNEPHVQGEVEEPDVQKDKEALEYHGSEAWVRAQRKAWQQIEALSKRDLVLEQFSYQRKHREDPKTHSPEDWRMRLDEKSRHLHEQKQMWYRIIKAGRADWLARHANTDPR